MITNHGTTFNVLKQVCVLSLQNEDFDLQIIIGMK